MPAHICEPGQWSALSKIGFRFLCAYLILFIGPGPIGYLPFNGHVDAIGLGA